MRPQRRRAPLARPGPATSAKRVAWRTLGERFEAEWPQLPADIQARLRAEVERSPVFRLIKAKPEALLYNQQLVAALAASSSRRSTAASCEIFFSTFVSPSRSRALALRSDRDSCHPGRFANSATSRGIVSLPRAQLFAISAGALTARCVPAPGGRNSPSTIATSCSNAAHANGS